MHKVIKFTLAILLCTVCMPVVMASDDRPGIKVFSMNLHCFEESWQERFNTILETVASQAVDVYAFQEVCIGEGEDQAAFLRQRLQELHANTWTTKTIFTHTAWDRYGEYLMIVARGGDLETRAGMLPDSPLPRGYVAIRFGDAWFVNTHLEYHEDNTAYRLGQLEFLVTEFRGDAHILMGDFNSSPVMSEQLPLRNADYEAYFPGLTFPAEQPVLAIDGFWISPLLSGRLGNVVASRLFGPGLAGGIQSDHLGVLLEVDYKQE